MSCCSGIGTSELQVEYEPLVKPELFIRHVIHCRNFLRTLFASIGFPVAKDDSETRQMISHRLVNKYINGNLLIITTTPEFPDILRMIPALFSIIQPDQCPEGSTFSHRSAVSHVSLYVQKVVSETPDASPERRSRNQKRDGRTASYVGPAQQVRYNPRTRP
jgi:hypothetical protein